MTPFSPPDADLEQCVASCLVDVLIRATVLLAVVRSAAAFRPRELRHLRLAEPVLSYRTTYNAAVDGEDLKGSTRVQLTMCNLFLATLVLVATSAKAAPPMPSELARTTWGWVGLTTPEQTLTIAEPERYTLRFSEDDRVALRADCNRGAGSVVFPEPGAIHFGVFAITRAMCPTGTLGDRFAREVVRAVRWAIQRGELRLELSGDAGVLRFTRQP